MKMSKKNTSASGVKMSRPAINQSKQTVLIIAVVIVTALMILWVYTMGRKATDTVQVVMTTQSIYKNQQITENMLQPYDMTRAEFEKYAIVDETGTPQRRVMLWSEKDMIMGAYAAYSLQANVVGEYRSFYSSKIDNTDSVLYSFPGKEIMSLDIATGELQTFKTFLEPGDRVTITAIYNEQADPNAGQEKSIDTFRTEIVFQDIVIADLLNGAGDSILDIYADYNGRSVIEQSNLDVNPTFQSSVVPSSLLVALTPEEKELYYSYLSKGDVSFRMSLPQRIE